MSKERLRNINWEPGENGRAPTWERVGIAVLLDIRDELQQLNRLLGCSNFTGIPRTLQEIRDAAKVAKCPKCGKLCKNWKGLNIHQSKGCSR